MNDILLPAHFVAGGLTFVLFWATALTVKGSPAHRARGRLFLLSLIPVGLSVGAILILRAQTFDPARYVQFVYLELCLLTVGSVAYLSIAWKKDIERFRGAWFRILGPILFASGALVFVAGAASGQPLPMILSSIGLVFGAAMVRFAWMRAAPHPKWWLGWHLNAVLLLSNAVHGTLLAVLYRALVDANGFDAAQLVTQPATLLLALVLRWQIGRRRGVPMRFSEPAAALAPA